MYSETSHVDAALITLLLYCILVLTFFFFTGWMFMKTAKPPDDVSMDTSPSLSQDEIVDQCFSDMDKRRTLK